MLKILKNNNLKIISFNIYKKKSLIMKIIRKIRQLRSIKILKTLRNQKIKKNN